MVGIAIPGRLSGKMVGIAIPTYVRGLNMNKRIWMGFGVMILAAVVARAEIKTAGALLVNLDAATLTGLNDGDTVAAWANAGTLGGSFLPVTAGQGPVLGASVGGVRAVTFAGTANSVMTNAVPPPATICGADTWSFETWVYNPTLENYEDVFSWTARNNWPGGLATASCAEFRYGVATYNAVEHFSYNVSWSGAAPETGAWHYLAVTRDVSGVERLFVDGKFWTVYTPPFMRIRADTWFTLGGVRDLASSTAPWIYPFSGSLSRLRIHADALSTSDVMANYVSERGAFGVTDAADVVWKGAAGTALTWSSMANWSGGTVPGSDDRVVIDNGGTAVVSTAVGSISRFFPVRGGLVMSNAAALTVPHVDGLNVNMGQQLSNTFNFVLSDGIFSMPGTNSHNLSLGYYGGKGSGVIGGGTAAAVLDVDKDINVGIGSNAVGRLTVVSGGEVYSSNGYTHVGVFLGGDGKVTINGGLISNRKAGMNVVVSGGGGRGVLEVNGGQVAPTLDLALGWGTAYATSYGAVFLNGGEILARRIYAATTAGTNLLYLNGGTLRPRETRSDFLYNLRGAYVQSGGAVFDVTGGVAVTVRQALEEDVASPGGGLVKRGEGTLILSGTNSYRGSTRVDKGTLVLACSSLGAYAEANPGATLVLAATNGTGEVRLSGGTATFASGYAVSGADTNRWRLNGTAQWLGDGRKNDLQLTANVNSQAGSAYLSERVAVSTPWEMAFHYDLINPPAVPGAGFAFFVQNDNRGVTALGSNAGGNGYNGIYRSVGAAITVFPNWNPKYDFMWASNGTQLAESKLYGLNGVVPTNGNLDVRMAYDGVGQLAVTLTQGANTFVTNRPVNIRSALSDSDTMLVGVSGGTGSNTADQRISAFRFSSVPVFRSDIAFAHTLAATAGGRSTVDAVFGAPITVGVERLRLAGGSIVDIRANPAAEPDTAYTLAFREVVLSGGDGTINVLSNGTAQGCIELDRLCINAAAKLIINGPVALKNGVITVVVPKTFPRGEYQIADFTSASGLSQMVRFVLEGIEDGRLTWSGGILRLTRGPGTTMFLP